MGEAALEGERWPFEEGVSGDFGKGGMGGIDSCWARVLATVFGERLRALARFSRLESEVSESSSAIEEGLGEDWRFVAERVMGAK